MERSDVENTQMCTYFIAGRKKKKQNKEEELIGESDPDKQQTGTGSLSLENEGKLENELTGGRLSGHHGIYVT